LIPLNADALKGGARLALLALAEAVDDLVHDVGCVLRHFELKGRPGLVLIWLLALGVLIVRSNEVERRASSPRIDSSSFGSVLMCIVSAGRSQAPNVPLSAMRMRDFSAGVRSLR
jgi:hypothetical protein